MAIERSRRLLMNRELQDDLSLFTGDVAPDPGSPLANFVEAARKYANPDIEAAAKARYEDVKRKAEQNGLIGFIDWDDLEDEERQEDWVDEIRPYVDAALGVTEDE